MKKTAFFCAIAAMACGAFAEDLMFEFSSSGDTYADGKAVENGEVYALVWSADGAFGGIRPVYWPRSMASSIPLPAFAT